jgi:hypothetical protein
MHVNCPKKDDITGLLLPIGPQWCSVVVHFFDWRRAFGLDTLSKEALLALRASGPHPQQALGANSRKNSQQ